MIGLVLVTHGNLANEFISAMQHVVGPQEQIAGVCIGPEDDMEMRREEMTFIFQTKELYVCSMISSNSFFWPWVTANLTTLEPCSLPHLPQTGPTSFHSSVLSSRFELSA